MNLSNIQEHNIIGTVPNKAKWLLKLLKVGISHKDAAWIYDQAVDLHANSGYPKPNFKQLIVGYMGVVDGINTAPAPGNTPNWAR